MKLVVYFAKASHPCVSDITLYDKIWPIFQASVEKFGYELIHLTDEKDTARCKTTLRYGVSTDKVVLAREQAWQEFLYSNTDLDETYCMVEPDTVLLRPIPELKEDCDFMILRRQDGNILPGIRLARKSAWLFYFNVLKKMYVMPVEKQTWGGDVDAHHSVLECTNGANIPEEWCGYKIDIREAGDYATAGKNPNAVMWNYKGTSKERMLEYGS